MKLARIVIDTNVLVSALRSSRGESYRLLMQIDGGIYQPAISVPLVLEYESAAKRISGKTRLKASDIDDIIDYICSVAMPTNVYYLWHPFLKDPKDDMVLETAVASGAKHIVTFNTSDFSGTKQFGITVVTPHAFLTGIGG